MSIRKIVSTLTAAMVSLTAFSGVGKIGSRFGIEAEAASSSYRFDFGSGGTAGGFTGVSATDGYNASKGYGFAQTWNMANVGASGSGALSDAVQSKGLTNISVIQTGCIGLCQYEPIVEVLEPGKEKVTYVKMNPEKAMEVLEKHLIGGQVISNYTISAELK